MSRLIGRKLLMSRAPARCESCAPDATTRFRVALKSDRLLVEAEVANRRIEATTDLFVGCSSEFLELPWKPTPRQIITRSLNGKSLANASQVKVNVWDDWSKTHTGNELFTVLDLAAKTHEWAILVFRADDLSRTVGDLVERAVVRDNVLFETGLFYGHIGPRRVFILEETSPDNKIKVASDLYGMLRLQFESPKTFANQLKIVLQTMQERSTQPYPRWTPASSLAIGYFTQLIEQFIKRRIDKFGSKQPFKLEILLPTYDFRELKGSDVFGMFKGLDFAQIGPEGTLNGRPALWVKKEVVGSHGLALPRTYFDVPTTLSTVEAVITHYLGDKVTPTETRDLVRNQANAFSSYIEQRPKSLTKYIIVKQFASVGDINDYLKTK
jgi:CAP12/Pycsar effector protein, TIR domain/Prokaryotic STING domain